MTSIGKRQSESMAAAGGQEVLWLAASAPPAQLVTFLRSRGLTLVSRQQLSSASPLKLLMIEASSSPATRAPSLNGRRIAVMHPDPGNADALAQALRAKGAEVVALSLNPGSLERVETLDPEAVIMEAGDFCSSCWEIVRALFQHPHLRFATVVLATPELMGSQQMSALDVHDLSFAVNEVAADYVRVVSDAQQLQEFSFALESLGPSRSLRALLAAGRHLRVSSGEGEESIEIDLAEQIIVGAQSPAGAAPGEGLLGVHALNLFLARRTGRVNVRSVDHPAHTNVMAPLDTALHMARDASSGVRTSGMHRPVFASSAPAATFDKPKQVPLHQRTLIGVPAVRLPQSKPALPPPAPPARARAVSLPPPEAVAPATPAPTSMPPSAPLALAAPAFGLRAPSAAPAMEIEPPAALPASFSPRLDTSAAADAEVGRALRARVWPTLAPHARWLSVGLLALCLSLWLFSGQTPTPRAQSTPPALPVALLSTKALAQPPPAQPLAAPVSEAAEQETRDDTEPVLGRQNRASARKASSLSNQGNAFRQKRLLPSARARYLEALRVYPAYPRALAGLTQLALSAGAAQEARDYAQQLVKARPGQAAYQLLLGDAQRAAGDDKQARAAYLTAARLGSRTAEERLAK